MSENKKYTIVVKSSRVEVSEAVYHAYHKERGEYWLQKPEYQTLLFIIENAEF